MSSSVNTFITAGKAQPNQEIVRFERVSLRYARGPKVLSDIDLSLKQGSFTFLTGPSGAGKTTILKLTNLDLKPSRGLIHSFGHDSALLDLTKRQMLKRRMGMVLQEFQLIDHLSVFENVGLPLRVLGRGRQSYKKDVLELLSWVGLGDRAHALPATLSGGEKQRAAIARAVISRPDILIADEPTGNVDAEIGRRLLRLFVEMNRLGTTVLIATHDISLIRDAQARILRIEDGQIREGLA